MPLPEALAWLDSRREALKRQLVDQFQDRGPVAMLGDMVKGAITGGAGMVDTAMDVANPVRAIGRHLEGVAPGVGAEALTREALDTPDNAMAGAGELMGPPVGKAAKLAALAKAAIASKTPAALATLMPAFAQQAKQAEALKNLGHTPDEIWKMVGAEHIPGQGWIREIPDTNARIPPNAPNVQGPLEAHLDHPELFADPEFQKLRSLQVRPMIGSDGGLNPQTAVIRAGMAPSYTSTPRGTILHEVGHHIQHETGMNSYGSNPSFEISKMLRDRFHLPPGTDPNPLWQAMDPTRKGELEWEGLVNYLKDPGERMSRVTEARASMPPEKLAEIRPGATPDPRSGVFFQQGIQEGRGYNADLANLATGTLAWLESKYMQRWPKLP